MSRFILTDFMYWQKIWVRRFFYVVSEVLNTFQILRQEQFDLAFRQQEETVSRPALFEQ